MINKEERQILKGFREMKKCGAKRIALIDTDIYKINDTYERWRLEDRIKELEEINREHQKLNGELQEKLTELEAIIEGKSIQDMGTSKLYLTYDKED